METSIYRYILQYTKRDQVLLLILSILSLPFVYITLEVPKQIINEALNNEAESYTIASMELGQIQFLLVLCFIYLGLVVLNGGFKYIINVYRGAVGERLLRRLRYDLYSRILRFPLPHFKKTSQGELIPMIVAETEPLGEFIGESFTLPVLQGGMLITYLSFIFIQDPVLGLAAVSMYPLQMYVIPKLQTKVNQLAKVRVTTVRKFSDRIGETVSGITEIHAHDTTKFSRATAGDLLGRIFNIRYEIYKKKFFIKFLNNFLDKIGPFFFYSMGGYFVIKGELSIGALIASLSAYKDISAPWKELLKYYQRKEDIKVKYTQVIEQFQPEGMLRTEIIDDDSEAQDILEAELVSTNVSYSEDDGPNLVDEMSLNLDTKQRALIVGLNNSGKTELGLMLGKLLIPTSGRLRIGDLSLADISESHWSKQVAYVGADAHIFVGSIRDNVYYGLKHSPQAEPEYDENQRQEREKNLKSAIASGNSIHDIQANWIDYKAAHVKNDEELEQQTLQCLTRVDMDNDLYQLGLRGVIDTSEYQKLSEQLLQARKSLRSHLQDPDMVGLVEPFDQTSYNDNMSVAENLLFGVSQDPSYQPENLIDNEEIRGVLSEVKIFDDLLDAGHKVAEVMVELFTDVDPDSDLFEKFSFISAEDLPWFSELLAKEKKIGLKDLDEKDQFRLISLSFKLVPARHRLGIIDEAMQERLLEARKALSEHWDDEKSPIQVFDPDAYHPAISIQDNILFGRLVHGQARAPNKVGEVIDQTISELDLKESIMRIGLDYEVGIGGSRLTNAQRQRLAIARCLIKHPNLLIVNQAASVLEASNEANLLENIIRDRGDMGLIWVTDRAELAENFDQIVMMADGKLRAKGDYETIKTYEEFQKLAQSA